MCELGAIVLPVHPPHREGKHREWHYLRTMSF
jgi:hypothetical protein